MENQSEKIDLTNKSTLDGCITVKKSYLNDLIDELAKLRVGKKDKYFLFAIYMSISIGVAALFDVYDNEIDIAESNHTLNSKLCAHSKWANESYSVINDLLHCKASKNGYQRLIPQEPIVYADKKDSVMVAIIKESE